MGVTRTTPQAVTPPEIALTATSIKNAHAERDNVRAADNFAERLPERRRKMRAWADCQDKLALGAEVLPGRFRKLAG